ncbi:Hypothetical predicted protein, partial [Olea europaea subsp. europaea]
HHSSTSPSHLPEIFVPITAPRTSTTEPSTTTPLKNLKKQEEEWIYILRLIE